MNSRKTRRGGGSGFNRIKAQTLRGSGIMTAIKKPFYGSKNPKYKLDVTESTSYDTKMYEIAGVIHLKVGEFSFIRAQSYIDQYLKKDIIENTLKKYPNASRIIGYNVDHIKTTYSKCGDYEEYQQRDPFNKNKFKTHRRQVCSCGTVCPGTYIISGIVLQPTQKTVSAGTRRLTQTRSRSKSKSN